MLESDCPICAAKLKSKEPVSGKDTYILDCPQCGRYEISGFRMETIRGDLASRDQQTPAALSHALRRAGRRGRTPFADTIIADVGDDPGLPTPAEQADNLMLLLGADLKPGQTWKGGPQGLRAVVGALDDIGLWFIVDTLLKTKLLESR